MADITAPNPRAPVTGRQGAPSRVELERRTREQATTEDQVAVDTETDQLLDILKQSESSISTLEGRIVALETELLAMGSERESLRRRVQDLEIQIELKD